jgi:hypothetical protein
MKLRYRHVYLAPPGPTEKSRPFVRGSSYYRKRDVPEDDLSLGIETFVPQPDGVHRAVVVFFECPPNIQL